MPEDTKSSNSKKYICWFILLFVASILILAATPSIVSWWTPVGDDLTSRSQFADQFGLANTLFSALAMGGVILAVLIQRDELNLQRQELIHQREVMISTRDVLDQQQDQLKAQSDAMQLQTFENTFFQLLRLYNEIVDEISTPYHAGSEKGRDAIAGIAHDLKFSACSSPDTEVIRSYGLVDVAKMAHSGDTNAQLRLTLSVYENQYKTTIGLSLGHYYRHIYNLIRYVDESFLTSEVKYKYVRFLRAQLSQSELSLLFYNGLSEHGKEKFKPLADKYHLFDNLPIGDLAWPSLASQYSSRFA